MHITLLVNRDLPSALALNHLLPALQSHRLSLLMSSRVGAGGGEVQELTALRFMEQTLFTDVLFPALSGRQRPPAGCLLTFDELSRDYCEGRMALLNRINTEEGFARYAEEEPELVLSIRYGVILRQRAIDLPRLGVLNLHSGLLPAYRGVMASFRALLAGETTLGCCLHRIIDEGIDTGPFIASTALPVNRDKSYLWHVCALYEAGCEAMAMAVDRLARGERLPAMAAEGEGAYFSFPGEAEFAAFRARGLRLWDGGELAELAGRFLDSAGDDGRRGRESGD